MQLDAQNIPLRETVDEIVYRRLPDNEGGWGKVPLDEYLDRYAVHLSRVVEEVRPAILHAASNFVNGCVAAAVGRAYNIPVVYEVRGFWEMTRASLESGFTNSLLFRSHQRLETQALETADAIVCISEGLKREIERRGIAAEKIWVVPNGVECAIFSPRPRDAALVAALGLEGKIVVGYLGSLEAYEGLDVLLRACAMLLRHNLPLKVVIGGAGAAKKKLEQLVKTLSLEETVHFPGHLSRAEVLRYYSILDICPFPRKDAPVCHLVPPLKPYEAMAMEKAVVVSNVEALREMVQEGETGLICRADEVESLAACIARLMENPQLRRQLGKRGRIWALAQRDWKTLGRRYLTIYDALGFSPPRTLSFAAPSEEFSR
jgi:glycosyltransferase involved in cell wall biosynthesis